MCTDGLFCMNSLEGQASIDEVATDTVKDSIVWPGKQEGERLLVRSWISLSSHRSGCKVLLIRPDDQTFRPFLSVLQQVAAVRC